ncbi:hypothetical protein, partial [Sphaerisporangium rufum]|uniref:hypothetical protein n=1 Tax=Sphaerisporangium rufum TaxID=1381558 RepID=UPI0035A25A0D
AQTDVTGVWGVPRRRRYRVYLAGIAWDLLLMAGLILLVAYLPLADLTKAVLQALIVTVLLSIPFQLQVYMRTDLYYVLRDLLRSHNLFDDGLAYSAYLKDRALARLRRRPFSRPDPTAGLAPHERRATRLYAVFLIGGAAISLGTLAGYGVPIALGALVGSLGAIAGGLNGGPVLPALDSALFLLIEAGIQLLFAVTFVRTHRHWFRRQATGESPHTSR